MIKPAVLDAMVAAGCSAEQIAAAVKADQAGSSGAARQARYRQRKSSQSDERCVTTVTVTDTLSPKESSPTPPKEITPIPVSEARASSTVRPKPGRAASDASIGLPTVSDGDFLIFVPDIEEWQLAFPAVPVRQQLASMRQWLIANPTKRKTARGMRRFVVSWLDRKQNEGGASSPRNHSPPKPLSLGEMFREDARQNGILNDQPPANSSGRMETGDRDGEVSGIGDARVIALTRNVFGSFR